MARLQINKKETVGLDTDCLFFDLHLNGQVERCNEKDGMNDLII
jgi:hypothetical protein